MKIILLCLLAALGGLVLAGCASSDQVAVQQVVTDSERAAENALNGKGSADAIQQYFAAPTESGNTDPFMARHIAYSAVLDDTADGKIQLSKFAINSITLWPEVNEARVIYQVDMTATKNGTTQTETMTQSLLLTKTLTRGWLIMGSDGMETTTGDASFLGNLGGQ